MTLTPTQKAFVFMHARIDHERMAKIALFAFGRRGLSQRISSRLYRFRIMNYPQIVHSRRLGYRLTPAGHAKADTIRSEYQRQQLIHEVADTFGNEISDVGEWLARLILERSDEELLLLADHWECLGDERYQAVRDWMKRKLEILNEKTICEEPVVASP